MSSTYRYLLAAVIASVSITVARAQERPAAAPAVRVVLPTLELPPAVAGKVGRQVFRNETGGNRNAIVAWNDGEAFASLGIGHFLWFPAGLNTPYEERFPALVELMRVRKVRLPAWLDKSPVPACPWKDKADFLRNRDSERAEELRRLLLDTFDVQTELLLVRMREALPKMLAATQDARMREHIRAQFNRVVAASKDFYPLIDYVNFKGEGIRPEETVPDAATGKPEGWGLRQALMEMRGTTDKPEAVLAEFAGATGAVLTRRVRNRIALDRVKHKIEPEWLKGWLNRVASYRRALP